MTVFTVAIGNFSFPPTKDQKKIAEVMKEEMKIKAICPMNPHGTLLLFETLNDAKEARNIFRSYGVKTGRNIVEGEFDFETNTMEGGKVVA